MTDNVIPLGMATTLKMPVDPLLDAAKGQLADVLIVGWDADGELYIASSSADCGEILWLIEKSKQRLLEV